ncbi:uncharacterized protein LOC108179569 [Tachysurus ichikawai]
MFLYEPELDVSFRVWHEGKSYMINASTGNMKCFECGDLDHKWAACPHKASTSGATGSKEPSSSAAPEISPSVTDEGQSQVEEHW